MAKESEYKGYVKTNTMLLASIISLAIGFLGGIVLSAYKSTSVVSAPPSMPPAQQSQQPAVSKPGPGSEEVSRTQEINSVCGVHHFLVFPPQISELVGFS